MSGEYTGKDIGKELSRLRSTNAPFDVLVTGSRGEHLVAQILDAVYKTINTDPDSVFYLMAFTANRLVKLSKKLSVTVSELFELVPLAVEDPVLPATADLSEAIEKLDRLILGPDATVDKLIAAYKEDMQKFLSGAKTASGKAGKKKSPAEAREEIMRLAVVARDLRLELYYLHRRFLAAVSRYETAELRKISVDQQARSIQTRLKKIQETGGEENLNAAFLASAVGYGLLSRRAKKLSVLADKYSGGYTLVPADAPSLTGTKVWTASSPGIGSGFESQPSGESVALTVPAATPPTVTVPVKMVTHEQEMPPLLTSIVAKNNFHTHFTYTYDPAVPGPSTLGLAGNTLTGELSAALVSSVVPGSVVIAGVSQAGTTKVIRDDGSGGFTGDVVGPGVLNYTTGEFSAEFTVPMSDTIMVQCSTNGRHLSATEKSFVIVVNNTKHVLTVAYDGPVLTPATVATAITTVAAGAGFSVAAESVTSTVSGISSTAHYLKFTGASFGARSRIILTNNDLVGANGGLNALYGLSSGAAVGEDTGPASMTYTAAGTTIPAKDTPRVSIATPEVTSGIGRVYVGLADSYGPAVLEVKAAEGALVSVGDTLHVSSARYRITEVTPSGENTLLALDGDMPLRLDSDGLPVTAIPDATSPLGAMPYTVTRDTVTISADSPAASATITHAAATAGGLGFGAVGTTAKSQADSFTLSGAVVGSPIRPGDVVYNATMGLVGVVVGVSAGVVTLDRPVLAGTTPTSIRIVSRGLVAYRGMKDALSEALGVLREVNDAEALQNLSAMYINSKTNYGQLAGEIQKYYAVADKVQTVYSGYAANVCSSMNTLLAGLREEKFEQVRTILLALRFDILTKITAAGVSTKTELDLLVESAVNFFDTGYEVLNPVPDWSTLEDYAADEGRPTGTLPVVDPR